MNMYGLIILAVLLATFVLNLVVDILNLGALKQDLPEEFSDVYPADEYARSREYARINTKFGLVVSVFELALLLGFWFAGGFALLDDFVRRAGQGPVLTGVFYIGILFLAKSLLSLPYSIYSTFVIEERFAFNKTSPGTFVADVLKGLGLGLVLGAPLIASIIAFFEYVGPWAWLYCWGAVTVFMLFVQFIAPAWIMPLFNKFTPLEDGELRDSILSYAREADFSLENIYVIDGSRRSGKSNAFFTGFGKNKRIALYDTLIEKHTVPELIAVLAHEIGHYKKKHILQGLVLGILQTGLIFYLLSFFLTTPALFEAFYVKQISVHAGLIFFSLLYAPVELALSVLMSILSRRNEYAADRFAAETYRDKEAMISALKKLSVHNLGNLTPHPWNVFLNYSHPPVLDRIRSLRELQ